jgi:hypothetical protein
MEYLGSGVLYAVHAIACDATIKLFGSVFYEVCAEAIYRGAAAITRKF